MRDLIEKAIQEEVDERSESEALGNAIVSWYTEIVNGNEEVEGRGAAVRERAFQRLERIHRIMEQGSGGE